MKKSCLIQEIMSTRKPRQKKRGLDREKIYEQITIYFEETIYWDVISINSVYMTQKYRNQQQCFQLGLLSNERVQQIFVPINQCASLECLSLMNDISKRNHFSFPHPSQSVVPTAIANVEYLLSIGHEFYPLTECDVILIAKIQAYLTSIELNIWIIKIKYT